MQKKVAEKTKCGQIKKKRKKKKEDSEELKELKESRFVLKEIDTHTDQIQSQWILICKFNTALSFKIQKFNKTGVIKYLRGYEKPKVIR